MTIKKDELDEELRVPQNRLYVINGVDSRSSTIRQELRILRKGKSVQLSIHFRGYNQYRTSIDLDAAELDRVLAVVMDRDAKVSK